MRETGYYWVLFRKGVFHDDWTIAYYSSSNDVLIVDGMEWSEESFEQIDEKRIER